MDFAGTDRALLRAASFAATMLLLQACAGRSETPALDLSPAIAMTDAVRERALAYPGALVTDVQENAGRTAACGLLRLPEERPHIILATRDDGDWTVSLPYLIEPGSWKDERNRTLSDAKLNICVHYGFTQLPTDR